MRKENRPADARAEIISDELGLLRFTEVEGIHGRVLRVPEEISMKFVRAAFRDSGHVAHLAVLGIIADALHLDFGDGFARRKGVREGRISGDVGDRNAIEGILRLRLNTALNREISVVVGLNSGQHLNELVGAGVSIRPDVGRQVEQFLRIERFLNYLCVGFDHACFGRLDGDSLRHLTDMQFGVDAQGLPGHQQQFRSRKSLETGGRRRDPIVPGQNVQ